jgi:biopolymer transport protein ExbD
MAEILLPNKHPTLSSKYTKLSTRVDLTPMVDLGFLLITFFIFTTTLSEPKAVNFLVPANGDSTQTGERKTLNLVLRDNNNISYYIGKDVGKQICTSFSPGGVRKVIRDMQQAVYNNFGNADEMVILIRPTAECSYMNLVDILDEIIILNVKKYALMDESTEGISSITKLKEPC